MQHKELFISVNWYLWSVKYLKPIFNLSNNVSLQHCNALSLYPSGKYSVMLQLYPNISLYVRFTINIFACVRFKVICYNLYIFILLLHCNYKGIEIHIISKLFFYSDMWFGCIILFFALLLDILGHLVDKLSNWTGHFLV